MPKVSEEYFEAKKLEIIDAAYRVALRKSISSMTLMDVREEAGMARGAIYRYYDSLDEILIALIAKWLDKERWEDEGDSIWEYDEIKDMLVQNIVNLSIIQSYMTINPDVYLEFYDSY